MVHDIIRHDNLVPFWHAKELFYKGSGKSISRIFVGSAGGVPVLEGTSKRIFSSANEEMKILIRIQPGDHFEDSHQISYGFPRTSGPLNVKV